MLNLLYPLALLSNANYVCGDEFILVISARWILLIKTRLDMIHEIGRVIIYIVLQFVLFG